MKDSKMGIEINLGEEALTEEERIIKALQKTWDYIGDDVLMNSSGKVSVDVVIEVSADRVDMFDKDVSRMLMKLSWEEIKKIGRKAFPWKYCVY